MPAKREPEFIFKPARAKRHHIFGEDKVSLCGSWSLPFTSKADMEEFANDYPFREGVDCKTCARKAGLEGVGQNEDE